MEVILTLTVIAFLVCGADEVHEFNISVTKELILSIKEEFDAGCVILWFNDINVLMGYRNYDVFLLWKVFAMKGIRTSAVPMRKINESAKKIQCHPSPSLHVLMPDSTTNRLALEEITARDAVYLLFLATESLTDFFSELYVPFDTEFLVAQYLTDYILLTEVYYVARNKLLQTVVYGKWTTKDGLTAPGSHFYQRRGDLQGLVLNLVNVNTPPISNYSDECNQTNHGGFIGRLWPILERSLNFTSRYLENKDRSYGQLRNGTYDGMVGMLQKGEADMGVFPIIMMSDRLRVVSFTMPLFELTFNIYVRDKNSPGVRWGRLLEPFHWTLWLVMLLTCPLITLALWTTLRVHRKSPSLRATFFLVCQAVFFQKGNYWTPTSTPARTVWFVMYCTGLVLMACYAATQTSLLTVVPQEPPIQSLQDIVADGSYKLGVNKRTAIYSMFLNSKTGILREAFRKLMAPYPKASPMSDKEGLKMLCGDDRLAYIAATELHQDYITSLPCNILKVPQAFYHVNMAFPLPKESPYKGIFNYNIQKMRAGGIIYYASQEFFTRKNHPEEEEHFIAVELFHIASCLAILCVTFILAVVILILECSIYWWQRRVPTKRKPEFLLYTRKSNWTWYRKLTVRDSLVSSINSLGNTNYLGVDK